MKVSKVILNRPLSDFRGIPALCFHDSTLSQNEVSGNSGAVISIVVLYGGVKILHEGSAARKCSPSPSDQVGGVL